MIPCVSDITSDAHAVTIPEALKPLGYVSVHIPKLHPNHILAVYSKSKEYAQRIQ